MPASTAMTLSAALAAALVLLLVAAAPEQKDDAPQDDAARLQYAPVHTPPPPREFSPEEPCSRVGGICLAADECPHGQLAMEGLCPRQRAQGVECCHGLSVRETRCARRGGECRPANCTVRDDKATDCRHGENCCILFAL